MCFPVYLSVIISLFSYSFLSLFHSFVYFIFFIPLSIYYFLFRFSVHFSCLLLSFSLIHLVFIHLYYLHLFYLRYSFIYSFPSLITCQIILFPVIFTIFLYSLIYLFIHLFYLRYSLVYSFTSLTTCSLFTFPANFINFIPIHSFLAIIYSSIHLLT